MVSITFCKEEKFKETPIGKIPKDWEVVKLGSNKVSVLIKSGSTPSKKVKDYWNGNIPFVTQSDMTKVEKYLYNTSKKITELGLKSSSLLLVPENSILLSMYGTIGKVVINKTPLAVSQNVAAIIPNKREVDEEYLYYTLQKCSSQFKKRAKIITLKHLDIKIVKRTLLPLPPLPEQKAIAHVLSTIDEAIQKINGIIEKIKRLKKGLMQELLTKGIGHKEFKDTEIGRIPKEWEVVRLKEVVLEVKPGFPCGKRDENGIIQLRMDSIDTEGWINPTAYVKVPPPKNVEKYLLKPGDILLVNTIGSLELLGKLAIFKGEYTKCTYSNHLTRIRVDPHKIIPEWVLYNLVRYRLLSIFRSLCHRHAGGQAMISKNDLLNLRIPLPSLEEQNKIVRMILAVDKKLKMEIKKKEKLERIKKALMDLLLTGKIRVKVNCNEQ